MQLRSAQDERSRVGSASLRSAQADASGAGGTAVAAPHLVQGLGLFSATAIVMGSMTVKICGAPAARIGDMTSHGGTIAMGLPTVMIGG